MMKDEKHNNTIKVNIGLVSIIVLLVTQLVVFAFGYGALNTQVKNSAYLIQTNQLNQSDILKSIGILSERIARLETLLK